MAETARLLGLGQRFTYEGKTYEIAPPEYEYMGEFELWLENRALEKIERQRGLVSDEVYETRHREMVRQVGAETFSRGSAEFQKAMKTYEGQKRLMFILIRAKDASVTWELVCRMFTERYNEMMARVLLAAQEANLDPNLPKAEPTPTPPENPSTSPSPPSAPSSPTETSSPGTSAG